jgi:uncharacterized protein (TIGR03437 family)
VGLNRTVFLAAPAALFFFSSLSPAAPRLHLSATTLGPISIAQGANGGTQTIEAGNTGDGALSVTLSSSVPWIATSVGALRTCSNQPGQCVPLQLTLNTSGLSSGMTTGVVTVTAPDAVDAPQTITVTVQMGGALPGGVDFTIGQGKTADIKFYTNKFLDKSRSGTSASWLSLVLDGVGSFTFGVPYHIHLEPGGLGVGTYTGTVTTAGSSDSIDNKQIPVTMHVTDQPVAVAATDVVRARLAQGAPPLTTTVVLNNLGLGTLNVSDASATGGDWVKAKAFAGGAVLTFDAAGISPGTYTGKVSFTTNSVTPVTPVPVEFTVITKGAPVISFNGVVDNAIFGAGDSLAGGDVAVVLGEQLSFDALTVGPAPPLTTQIGGAQVLVNGTPAPMYYSSYGQLAFEVPYGLSLTSNSSVQVVRDGQTSNTVSIKIVPRAPRLLQIGIGTFGAVVNQDGSLPLPDASIVPGSHPAHPGDTLTIYAIGLGPSSPGVLAGAPAPSSEPLSRLTQTPDVNFFNTGAISVIATPFFAGLTPTFAGLYQVNVTIPANAPRGIVNLTLGFTDALSNAVQIAIQ